MTLVGVVGTVVLAGRSSSRGARYPSAGSNELVPCDDDMLAGLGFGRLTAKGLEYPRSAVTLSIQGRRPENLSSDLSIAAGGRAGGLCLGAEAVEARA